MVPNRPLVPLPQHAVRLAEQLLEGQSLVLTAGEQHQGPVEWRVWCSACCGPPLQG